ncbi:MAG: flagellar motor protein MotA [Kangiellaceae bacterium]|nr:flagellar motor protein MotA [Kangiellaceae bacterium]
MIETVAQFFDQGGVFMYIILAVLAIGLGIAIERFIYLEAAKGQNKKMWKRLYPLVAKGDFRVAMNDAQQSKTAIGKILSYGLATAQTTARRDSDVELAMEEGLMEAIPRLEKRTQYLATFANIATLLGLLGTILGLIKAFTAVSDIDPAQKASMLSESISIAMNTTAFGLIAAIPLLLLYTWLQARTTEVVDSLEMASVKFINLIRQAQSKARAAQQ